MKDEYDLKNMKRVKNPFYSHFEKVITVNSDINTYEYFKDLSKKMNIPCEALINLYLRDCANKGYKLKLDWNKEGYNNE